MGTESQIGLMTVKDEDGSKTVLYPITKPEAVEGLYGINNQSLSESVTRYGEDNVVGLRGYYYSAIDFKNKTITLSTEQGGAEAPEGITWAKGDVVSIVNGGKYEECATITAVNGNVITLDSLPFEEIAGVSSPSLDDWSVYVSVKPDAGVVDLGKGAVALGLNNQASNWCAVAIGKDNKSTAQHAMSIGRLNKVKAYAGFASGRGNIVHPNAKYARASGLMNEASGENSVAEGHECKAKARGARAAGYKTVAGGEFSETAGWETETEADASYSYAGGQKTKASAWYAFVTGIRTISSKLQGHFVTGRYNKPVSELFTIGCGTSDSNRQNALGVKLDGTTDVYGHKITNVATGTAAGDAVNKAQLDSITKESLGLGNVDNTADADKSVSRAKNADYASQAGNAETVDGRHFHWEGRPGVTPLWVWGCETEKEGADGNNYVFMPRSFHVAHADTAGSVEWANVQNKPALFNGIVHSASPNAATYTAPKASFYILTLDFGGSYTTTIVQQSALSSSGALYCLPVYVAVEETVKVFDLRVSWSGNNLLFSLAAGKIVRIEAYA